MNKKESIQENKSNFSSDLNKDIHSESHNHEIYVKQREKDYYKRHYFKSEKPELIYLISIIDFLQLYNTKKYLETVFKSIFVAPTKQGEISSVSPDKYYARFIKYLNHITYLKANRLSENENQEEDVEKILVDEPRVSNTDDDNASRVFR